MSPYDCGGTSSMSFTSVLAMAPGEPHALALADVDSAMRYPTTAPARGSTKPVHDTNTVRVAK